MPLARALSKLGLATRTEARRLIEAGRVTVGGRIVTEPLAPMVPELAGIAIDGRLPAAPLTVLLHKPRGFLTTRSDPRGRPAVYDCIAELDTRRARGHRWRAAVFVRAGVAALQDARPRHRVDLAMPA